MSYQWVKFTDNDGREVSKKEYKRSRFIAFLLAVFFGGFGIHFLYARNYQLFWVMVVAALCSVLWIPDNSLWLYAAPLFGILTGFRYLFMSEERFFDTVNGY